MDIEVEKKDSNVVILSNHYEFIDDDGSVVIADRTKRGFAILSTYTNSAAIFPRSMPLGRLRPVRIKKIVVGEL